MIGGAVLAAYPGAAVVHMPGREAGRQRGHRHEARRRTADTCLRRIRPQPKVPLAGIRLAWIEGWDDHARIFSLTFAPTAPGKIQDHDDSDDEPFHMFGSTSRRRMSPIRQRPGQPRFKLKVVQRYGMRCPLSGVTVPEMLDAVHLVPDADDGASDPATDYP
jgi:hypothetical protein